MRTEYLPCQVAARAAQSQLSVKGSLVVAIDWECTHTAVWLLEPSSMQVTMLFSSAEADTYICVLQKLCVLIA